jgi:fumarylacetoacetate (FAA) hydrolase
VRLATLRDGTRDGALLVVGRDGRLCAPAAEIARSLQAALDDWPRAAPALTALAARLDRGEITGERLDEARLGPPLPRAYEWVDGSAFLNHVRLVRKARNATPPPTLEADPLVYQGGSGVLLGPRDDLHLGDSEWGLDFESEVAVILGDVPRGTKAAGAAPFVRLVLLANDVTLRNLVPGELAKGFGFFQSKPATAFSPFAVTPDELGDAWRDGRVHLPLRTTLKRAGAASHLVGDPDAGAEMHFSFFDLIAHAAHTRALTAGTILGSGTVSNADPARGVSCLAELRARETIAGGAPVTPYLGAGDAIAIEMHAADGRDIFGRIAQRVVST